MSFLSLRRLLKSLDVDVDGLIADVATLTEALPLAEKSSTPGSGASYTFTGITTDTALLVLEGVSHNSGAGPALMLEYTTDGSSWTFWRNIINALADTDSLYATVHVVGLVSGRCYSFGARNTVGFPVATEVVFNGINPGVQIVGLRATWSAGSVDGGNLARFMTPGGV